MAHNAFSSRPWKRTLVPAGALVLIFIFLVAQYHDNILYSLQSVQSDKNLDAASSVGRPSVEHTAQGKTKAIVTAVQTKDETTADWLAEFLPDWEAVVYVTDRSSDEAAPSRISRIPLQHLPVNKGREAAVYLTYIVQHYHNLPDYVVFIHGKRYQIHNDDPMLDTLPLIERLNLDHVRKEGYASLRCNWMHCPKAQVSPNLGHGDDLWSIDGLYASAWTEFFPNETVPNAVSGPCCAQFAVTREAVQRLPIDKYEQIRQWIWTLEVKDGEASMKAGLVLEYMWHILFASVIWSAREKAGVWDVSGRTHIGTPP
ncbi:hypothetical protein E2P81_ATG10144 [Venturia nashicola]|nr:hypothetical protein E2P81_ATG10144 [Venturia nashicola]